MKEVKTLYVDAGEDGVRLDRWFKRHYPGIQHSLLEKHLRKGLIRVDGKKAKTSDRVVTGQVIARGNSVSGDHLFVNRVKWNFIKPKRGEVMVFRTDGIPIPRLTEKTHYIKRMCGVPGEDISIREPALLVNGKPARDAAGVCRVADREPGYSGYCPGGPDALFIRVDGDALHLGKGQYLALGDNTHNSLDGRYWGPVPSENLVGPAMVVYWPFSKRWGWIH